MLLTRFGHLFIACALRQTGDQPEPPCPHNRMGCHRWILSQGKDVGWKPLSCLDLELMAVIYRG